MSRPLMLTTGAGLLLAACAWIATSSRDAPPSVVEAERRVAELSTRFTLLADQRAAMDALAEQIHDEIDRYITATVTPESLGSRWIPLGEELRRILTAAGDAAAPPIVIDPKSTAGALVVAYTIHKGGWHGEGATSFRLRAYRVQVQALALAATTGGDLDGYAGNSIQTLKSSGSSETWFVVHGRLTGANGPNVRMRAFAYKAGRFTTTWMPANAWGEFAVIVTDHGFTVDGPYYRSEGRRHEVYSVSPGYIAVAH